MKKSKIISAIAISFTFLIAANNLYGQFDLTMYNFNPVIQTNQANPAFIPKYQYHVGIPGLSSVYAQMGTSGIKYNQLFTRRADDSLIINFNDISNHIKNNNNIGIRLSEQWLNGGMLWKKYYFNFAVSDIIDFNMMYSNDLVNLAVHGNGTSIGKSIDLAPTFLKATHYREYAFGAAYNFDSKWNFGAKVKMLFGKSNIHTKTLDAKLYTAENTYFLTTETNMLINTSVPKQWFNGGNYSNSEYLFYGGSFGLSIDLGATYKLDDKYSFSASILDLGYIKFDRNYLNYSTTSNQWTFEGIDALAFRNMTNDQVNNKITSIGDSLINKFDIKESWHSYNILMTAKIYLGATYKLSDKENIGVLVRSEIVNKILRPSFTATYYRQMLNNLGVIGSYSIINRSYSNIGAGIYYNIEPVQIYLVSDNIAGIFVPDAVKYANFHFGVNIIFS